MHVKNSILVHPTYFKQSQLDTLVGLMGLFRSSDEHFSKVGWAFVVGRMGTFCIGRMGIFRRSDGHFSFKLDGHISLVV